MNINDAILGRRSTREYTTQAVDEHIIRRLINAAVHAPSAVNQQPWAFTVIRDQGLLDRVSREAKAYMLATMPSGARSEHFRSILNDENFHIFYHAPVLILISGNEPGEWVVEDCALAAENLMLAAYADGLAPAGSVSPNGFSIPRMEKMHLAFPPSGRQSRPSSLAIRSLHRCPSRTRSQRSAGSADLTR